MCDCLAELSGLAKDHGVWIDRTLLDAGKAIIATSWYPGYKRKRGQRLPVLIAAFCPFCGTRYEDMERLNAPADDDTRNPEGGCLKEDDFEREVSSLLKRLSIDALYGTPDYLLARFLRECLQTWGGTLKRREEWFGRPLTEAGQPRVIEETKK